MKVVRIALVALVGQGLFGCGPALLTTLPPVTEPSEKEPTGTVALVLPGAFQATFQPPGVVGAGQGAAAGAVVGGTIPIMVGFGLMGSGVYSRPSDLLIGLAVAGAGVALSPIGAAVGAAAGALAAPTREETDRNMAALERALTDTRVPETLVAEILEAGHGYRILAPIVERPDAPTPPVDAFLELDGPRVSLASHDPTDWTPELRLRVTLDARLVRASDREELRSWTLEHEGRKARLSDWARGEAQLFRVELARALRALAIQTVYTTWPAKK